MSGQIYSMSGNFGGGGGGGDMSTMFQGQGVDSPMDMFNGNQIPLDGTGMPAPQFVAYGGPIKMSYGGPHDPPKTGVMPRDYTLDPSLTTAASDNTAVDNRTPAERDFQTSGGDVQGMYDARNIANAAEAETRDRAYHADYQRVYKPNITDAELEESYQNYKLTGKLPEYMVDKDTYDSSVLSSPTGQSREPASINAPTSIFNVFTETKALEDGASEAEYEQNLRDMPLIYHAADMLVPTGPLGKGKAVTNIAKGTQKGLTTTGKGLKQAGSFDALAPYIKGADTGPINPISSISPSPGRVLGKATDLSTNAPVSGTETPASIVDFFRKKESPIIPEPKAPSELTYAQKAAFDDSREISQRLLYNEETADLMSTIDNLRKGRYDSSLSPAQKTAIERELQLAESQLQGYEHRPYGADKFSMSMSGTGARKISPEVEARTRELYRKMGYIDENWWAPPATNILNRDYMLGPGRQNLQTLINVKDPRIESRISEIVPTDRVDEYGKVYGTDAQGTKILLRDRPETWSNLRQRSEDVLKQDAEAYRDLIEGKEKGAYVGGRSSRGQFDYTYAYPGKTHPETIFNTNAHEFGHTGYQFNLGDAAANPGGSNVHGLLTGQADFKPYQEFTAPLKLENWLGKPEEVHADLVAERAKEVRAIMNRTGMPAKDAVAVFKAPEYYDNFLKRVSSGKGHSARTVKDHFKEGTSPNVIYDRLKILPSVGATTGAGLAGYSLANPKEETKATLNKGGYIARKKSPQKVKVIQRKRYKK